MPRSASGIYTLPLPPVVPDTLITAEWANTTMADLAQALTDSLDREGRGGMNSPIRVAGGTALQPGFSFTGATSTGIYSTDPSLLQFSVNGTQRLSINSAEIIATVPLRAPGLTLTDSLRLPDGTAPLPGLSFASDATTGVFLPAAGVLGFSTAGVQRATLGSDGNFVTTGGLRTQDANGTLAMVVGDEPFFQSINNGVVEWNLRSLNNGSWMFRNVSLARDMLALEFGGNVVPGADDTQDFGSTTLRWSTLHANNLLRSSAGTLTLNSADAAGTIALRTAGADRLVVASSGAIYTTTLLPGFTNATFSIGENIPVAATAVSLSVKSINTTNVPANVVSTALRLASSAAGADVHLMFTDAAVWNQAIGACGVGAASEMYFATGNGAVPTKRLSISAAGSITEAATGRELGYKDVPVVFMTLNGWIINQENRGCCMVSSAGNTASIVSTAVEGCVISVLANNGVLSLIQDAGVTMFLAGTSITGNRTLAPNGLATIWWINSTQCYISGAGVS